MAITSGLYTPFYLKTMHDYMEQNKLRWYIDSAGTLWHIDDISSLLNKSDKKASGYEP